MKNKIKSIKEKIPQITTLPDGYYNGIWGGHVIDIYRISDQIDGGLHDLEYKQHTMEKIFERYELLCKDVTHQIGFLNDYYQMDFEYLQETLDEMKELQKKIIQNQ